MLTFRSSFFERESCNQSMRKWKKRMLRLLIVNCAFLVIIWFINFSFCFDNFSIILFNFILSIFVFFILFCKSMICVFVFVNRSLNWFVRIWTRLIVDYAKFTIAWIYSWLRRHCFKSTIALFLRFSMQAKMTLSRRSTFSNSRTTISTRCRKRFEN